MMRHFLTSAIILTAFLVVQSGCSSDETSVRIRFKSSQVGANYTGTARYALAVPQGDMVKVFLFETADSTCEATLNEQAVAELYLPGDSSGTPGIKFAPPSRPNWVTAIRDEAPMISRQTMTDTTFAGCIDQKVDLSSSGNQGSIKGCFKAKLCPPRPLDRLASRRGASSMEISMSMPGKSWSRHVSNSIAFLAEDVIMVFFQDSESLNCENYRVVPKQGLLEFRYTKGQTSFLGNDVVKVAPVDPDNGWSFHFNNEQVKTAQAEATLSPDRSQITGTVDVSTNGVDELSRREYFGREVESQKNSEVFSRMKGSFTATVCPEF